MSNWRDQKLAAREVVQATFRVPAFYWAPSADEPVRVNVRVHTKFKALGDMAGTNYDFASVEEATPKIVFWMDELLPDYQGIVAVGPSEAYAVGKLDPTDYPTQTADVTRLSEGEAAEYWPGA